MEILSNSVVEFVVAVVIAILTTISGLVIKHFYNKATEKEQAAKKEAERKIAEAQAAAEKQKQEYERLLKEEQTRNHRQMILDELEPIVEEINRVKQSINSNNDNIKAHIKKDEKEFENRLDDLKNHHNTDRENFDDKIKDLAIKHEENLSRIRESYKFRFIQLCKIHLRDGYITESEWEQIVMFYDLYHGLGGNGQAEDYYNKVKELEVVPDED